MTMTTVRSRAVAATLALALALCAGLARAEVVQHGGVRAAFSGKLTPHVLPRHGSAPVRVSVATKITATNGQKLPQLRRISIAINSHGHFDPAGLPICPMREIQPSTTADALAACRDSLVGTGRFSASVSFTEQAPFPSAGKVYAFNSRLDGRPAILAHVYGTKPIPTSFTLPFVMKPGRPPYGTVLEASLPEVTGSSSHITGLSLNLGRKFSIQGRERSYLSAGCPAPKGFVRVAFPFARASFAFTGHKTLTSTLTRSCTARN
jgi:hypothetical protein